MILDIAEDLKNNCQRKWETAVTSLRCRCAVLAAEKLDGRSVRSLRNARPLGLGVADKISADTITSLMSLNVVHCWMAPL